MNNGDWKWSSATEIASDHALWLSSDPVNFWDSLGLYPGDWWDPRTPSYNINQSMEIAKSMKGGGGNDSDHHAIAVREFGRSMQDSYNSEIIGGISSLIAASVGNCGELFAPRSDAEEDMLANMLGIAMFLEDTEFVWEHPEYQNPDEIIQMMEIYDLLDYLDNYPCP